MAFNKQHVSIFFCINDPSDLLATQTWRHTIIIFQKLPLQTLPLVSCVSVENLPRCRPPCPSTGVARRGWWLTKKNQTIFPLCWRGLRALHIRTASFTLIVSFRPSFPTLRQRFARDGLSLFFFCRLRLTKRVDSLCPSNIIGHVNDDWRWPSSLQPEPVQGRKSVLKLVGNVDRSILGPKIIDAVASHRLHPVSHSC